MFKEKSTDNLGYTLIDEGFGLWKFKTPKGIFVGSLKEVCRYSVIDLDFPINEIEDAVIEMDKHFHNAAVFGYLQTFMWSCDLEENNGKTIRH